jgi:hypothetical protein
MVVGGMATGVILDHPGTAHAVEERVGRRRRPSPTVRGCRLFKWLAGLFGWGAPEVP